MNFGDKLKSLRINHRLTLLKCSVKLGIDVSNLSKLERGVNPAPKEIEVLEKWAGFFRIHGAEKQELFDLAALSRKRIPADIAEDKHLMEKLPAFFRVVRGRELKHEKLAEFIEDLKKLHIPS
jgi:transcriptional regulator with XRE-family HTH domain